MSSLAAASLRRLALVSSGALLLLGVLAASQVPAPFDLVRRVLPAPPVSSQPTGPVLARAAQRNLLVVGVRSYVRPAPPGAPTPAEPDRYAEGVERVTNAPELERSVQRIDALTLRLDDATASLGRASGSLWPPSRSTWPPCVRTPGRRSG